MTHKEANKLRNKMMRSIVDKMPINPNPPFKAAYLKIVTVQKEMARPELKIIDKEK